MHDTRKHPLLGPLAALSLILLMPGCDSESPTAATLTEGDVPFEILWDEQMSTIDTSRRDVLRVEADLVDLWDELQISADLPTVNFNLDMVVVVASGEQPTSCHDIDVTGAVSDGTDLTVTVTGKAPITDCLCLQVIVQPVEVIRVPRADQVFFNDLTVDACVP